MDKEPPSTNAAAEGQLLALLDLESLTRLVGLLKSIEGSAGCQDLRLMFEKIIDSGGTWYPIESAPRDGTPVLLRGGVWGDDYQDAHECIRVGWWEKSRRPNGDAFWNTGATESGFSCLEYQDPQEWMPCPQSMKDQV